MIVESVTIECLRCGQSRSFARQSRQCHEAGECPRCRYVGWAFSTELSERSRKLLRDIPLERRFFLRPVG